MAHAVEFKLEIRGLKAAERKLNKLGKFVTKSMLNKAVTQGLKPVRDEVKRRAKEVKDTGVFGRSITVKKVKSRRGTAVGIVGAWNKKYTVKRKAKTRRGRGSTGAFASEKIKTKDRTVKTIIRNPAAYAHLIELGTVRSKAHPIFRPAIRATKQKSEMIMLRTLRAEVKKKINTLKASK